MHAHDLRHRGGRTRTIDEFRRLAAITFESGAGGRIVEQTREGVEHDCGRVLDWEPPTRLRYSWHLFFDGPGVGAPDLLYARVHGRRPRVTTTAITSLAAPKPASTEATFRWRSEATLPREPVACLARKAEPGASVPHRREAVAQSEPFVGR